MGPWPGSHNPLLLKTDKGLFVWKGLCLTQIPGQFKDHGQAHPAAFWQTTTSAVGRGEAALMITFFEPNFFGAKRVEEFL